MRVESKYYAAQIATLDVNFSVLINGVCEPSLFAAPDSPSSMTKYTITSAGTNKVEITIPEWT